MDGGMEFFQITFRESLPLFKMKIFLRLLSYIKPYRYRFALGVLVSFFVAALNGLSLSLFIPFSIYTVTLPKEWIGQRISWIG